MLLEIFIGIPQGMNDNFQMLVMQIKDITLFTY